MHLKNPMSEQTPLFDCERLLWTAPNYKRVDGGSGYITWVLRVREEDLRV